MTSNMVCIYCSVEYAWFSNALFTIVRTSLILVLVYHKYKLVSV